MSAPTTTSILVLPRSMGTFVADCVLEERHDDSWVITDHPVEQGSTITDHVYKMPAMVVLTYSWAMMSRTGAPTNPQNTSSSPTFLQQLYKQLLAIQQATLAGVITPFAVYTGKRVYLSMLLQNLAVTTDPKTENVLTIRATCKELIVVTTQTFVNSAALASPATTAPVVQSGQGQLTSAPNFTSLPSMNLGTLSSGGG